MATNRRRSRYRTGIETYGEERFAKRIARAIVERNREQPMTRTKELAEVVAAATPVKDKFKHPATRTFRAVRIWVNSELEEIEQALKARSTCWPRVGGFRSSASTRWKTVL